MSALEQTAGRIKNKFAPQAAPSYENNISTKFDGYNLKFNFPTCPVQDEQNLSFLGYINSVKDTFKPYYSAKEVYGRMDPIPVYSRTTRNISFDLSIPSNGLEHSRQIADKLNILVRNIYPSYQKNGVVNVISSPPLVKVLFSSFIRGGKDQYLLGYFTSDIVIEHDLKKGVFARDAGHEAYAKSYKLNFSMSVLHDFTPGFISEDNNAVTNSLNILRGQK